MKVSKPLVYANLTALSLNGVLLCLMAAKAFPPLLGMALLLVFLAGAVALSCYLNGQWPRRKHRIPFHTAPTRKVMRCAVRKQKQQGGYYG
ncbi:MAG TPA: hypothetical protein VKY19_18695 [Ktedonosporobacter sp.]|jgi:hypothetical protein|nr:hypothetical protein [Ktedonosporobacter sp.]